MQRSNEINQDINIESELCYFSRMSISHTFWYSINWPMPSFRMYIRVYAHNFFFRLACVDYICSKFAIKIFIRKLSRDCWDAFDVSIILMCFFFVSVFLSRYWAIVSVVNNHRRIKCTINNNKHVKNKTQMHLNTIYWFNEVQVFNEQPTEFGCLSTLHTELHLIVRYNGGQRIFK